MKIAARLAIPVLLPAAPAPKLIVNVICTRLSSSAGALEMASRMAHGLGARVALHLAREVPYPLPLTAPPVTVAFTEEKLTSVASDQSLETSVQIYLCRDFTDTIRQALQPDSVVVIASPRRWWRTREDKLAAILQRDGHHVILTHAN